MKNVELNNTYAQGGGDGNITIRFQEMCLLISADSKRYSGILDDSKNSTLLGMDNYQNNPTTTYGVLWYYKNPTPQRQSHTPPRDLTFIQSYNTSNINTVPGNDGRSFVDVTCYRF